MENVQTSTQQATSRDSIPFLDTEHGYYASASVTKSPADIFAFCQNEENVEKVLGDLPQGINNFLQLMLVLSERIGSEEYRIVWQNKPGLAAGTLTFLLKSAPLARGTIITAEAVFEKIKFKEDGPSSLMNVFLKRMKALMETGVLATTKGQPSGRKEVSSNSNNIH